jgi:hypothetical protein
MHASSKWGRQARLVQPGSATTRTIISADPPTRPPTRSRAHHCITKLNGGGHCSSLAQCVERRILGRCSQQYL